MAEKAKERGNTAFLKGEYQEALEYYSKAIRLDPKNHVLFSNRSACYLLLAKPEKALEDAEAGLSLKDDWPKNYYRKAEALFALRKFGEIFGVVSKGKKLDEKMFEEILERTKEQLLLEQLFAKKTDPLGIHVRLINKTKGKGVFALKDFGANETVFSERPVLTIQKTNNKETVIACSHCVTFIGVLKAEFQGKPIGPPYAPLCENTIAEPHQCSGGCGEVFCSVNCEKSAKYHSLLCPGKDTSEGNPIRAFRDYSQKVTYRFDLAAKVLALIVTSSKEAGKTVDPFARFVRTPWTAISHYDAATKRFEHEEALEHGTEFSLMKEAIVEQSLELLKATPVYSNEFDSLFTFDNYNNLLGMIEVNGANIESLPRRDTRLELMGIYQCMEDQVPFSSGTGLFTIHSNLNHGCKPNAEVVGGLVDSKDAQIRVITLRPIQKGEEVVISYIEEPNRKPREERQKELKGGYQFECQCTKCEREKD